MSLDGLGQLSAAPFWFSGCGTGPEAEAVVSGFQNVAVVGEAIEQRSGHLGIAEDVSPLAEAEVGRVPAAARLGRFYCEAYLRLKLTGRADNLRLDLGLSQDQIADVLGLSSVHINRSLRKLREKKLISRERHVYIIHDWDRLVDECQFDATYLSLMKQPR